MPDLWYYGNDNGQLGPVPMEPLKQLVASGQVQTSDFVWAPGMSDWVPARDVQQLLPQRETARQQPAQQPPAAPPLSSVTKAKVWADVVASRTKAAARLSAKHVHRLTILKTTLPRSYCELGRQVYAEKKPQADFSDAFQRLDDLLVRVKTLEANQPTTEGFAAKTKAVIKTIGNTIQAKALRVQVNLALTSLGKLAFEKFGEQIGSEEVICPSRTHWQKSKR